MSQPFFQKAVLRSTPRRREILRVLTEAGKPLAAEEIHLLLSSQNMNLSTVYRALGALLRCGILMKSIRQDGTAEYQHAGAHHSHHLVCLACGRRCNIAACPLEAVAQQLEQESGYFITGHSLEFTGLCPDCQRKKEEPV